MAYETLVTEVSQVVEALRQEGDLVLAMLVASSWEQDAPWNLVVSAEWMDNKSRKEVIGLVTDLLRKHVSRNNWQLILMVSVLKTTDPFVQAMNQAFDIKGPPANIQNCEFYGFEVARAILFESHRPRPLTAAPR